MKYEFGYRTVPEIIDPVFAKTSPKRSFSMTEYERFGLVFTKTRVYKFGHWRHYKEKGKLSLAFEKDNSQWKYTFESRHSRTKIIFQACEKFRKKTKIYHFLYFFTFIAKKMSFVIGQKRSILKIQKHP